MSETAGYGRILKASSIMGSAAGVTMLLGLVRTKFAAVLLGTAGIGALANFSALQGLIGVIAGLGIQTSAVRYVAAAVANGDEQAIARTILSLRRVCWITGLIGAAVMMAGSSLLSIWTFGGPDHQLQIIVLGVAVLLSNLYGGQIALIQGMQRIGDLGRVQIVAAAFGAVASIILYAALGAQGIVPALLLTAAAQFFASWRVARQIPVAPVSMTWLESVRAAGGMARMGAAVMWSAVLVNLVGYATNALIVHQFRVEAVGVYSAAFALSGIFVNFVLNAMASDFYPRLTGLVGQKEAMVALINQQTEIGLLLATPGLLATMSLAPWIIELLYSASFSQATTLLQWFVLGCFGRVIAWPMSFVMLAQGSGHLYVIMETLFGGLHLALLVAGLRTVGLEGVSVAFFVLYVAYTAAMWRMANRVVGFRWSPSTARVFLLTLPAVAATFLIVRLLPVGPATIGGVAITCVASLVCLRELVSRVDATHPIVRAIRSAPGVSYLWRAP